MEDEEIATGIEVFNLEGAGGTVGLQRLVNEEGNADMLMQMGLGVVGAQFSNQSEATLDQTTPVAKLIEEAEAIVVPGDSPYQSHRRPGRRRGRPTRATPRSAAPPTPAVPTT